jgi:hypothetical protein
MTVSGRSFGAGVPSGVSATGGTPGWRFVGFGFDASGLGVVCAKRGALVNERASRKAAAILTVILTVILLMAAKSIRT